MFPWPVPIIGCEDSGLVPPVFSIPIVAIDL